MSYNYLPLDSKWLNFQQVKNLLDYNQHVSITFDAHEKILKCRQYLDKKSGSDEAQNDSNNKVPRQLNNIETGKQQVAQLQNKLLIDSACGIGEEVSQDIVKLMLMLKIKSLSYGNSGVDIETMKRLMEMYNHELYPVIYTHGGGFASLSHLSLPLIGLGEVYYKGEKRQSADVLKELDWEALELQSNEGLAMITGTQFTSAHGMFALKKAEQLLQLADVIAALSFDSFGCSSKPFREKLQTVHNHKKQAETAAVILKYLGGAGTYNQDNQNLQDSSLFNCIIPVHGATKDTFDHVLNIFLKEINSVTENRNIFPDEDLIINRGNSQEQPLALAMDFLAIALMGLVNISEKRIAHLVSGQLNTALFAKSELITAFKSLHETAVGIVIETKRLCTPASVDSTFSNSQPNDVSLGPNAATKCLRVIDNIEKVLAIELMCAAQTIELKRGAPSSPFLNQFLKDFLFVDEDKLFYKKLDKTIAFIADYQV